MKAFKEFSCELMEQGNIGEDCVSDKADGDEDDVLHVDCSSTVSSECTPPCLPFHIRCASHTLSLVSTTDSKEMQHKKVLYKTFSKCSALWNKSGRPKSAEIIKEAIGCQLTLPVITRWNSFYDGLSVILKKRAEVNVAMRELNIPQFTDQDFDIIKEYLLVMNPIATGLDYLQRDSDSHYGIFLPTVLAIDAKLSSIELDGLKHCKGLWSAVVAGFKRRFKSYLELDFSEECQMAIIATVTHPEYKLAWTGLKDSWDTEEVKEKVKNLIISKLKAIECNNNEVSVEKQQGKGLLHFFGLPANEMEQSNPPSTSIIDIEYLQYISHPSTSYSSLQNYRHINKLFFKYNTPLPSSAAVERLFSTAGMIYSPRRTNMTDDTFEQLVMLRANKNLFT